MRANHAIRSVVDVFSFSTGIGLFVILDKFFEPNGNQKEIFIGDKRLAALATATTGNSGIAEVLRIVGTNPPLSVALRDLVEINIEFHRTPTNAAWVVEALRRLVTPTERDIKKQWKKFREALQLSQSYLTLITDTSTGPRHGDPTHIPGRTTQDIAIRAWTVMNRYLEFWKRGGVTPLPISEFPFLT